MKHAKEELTDLRSFRDFYEKTGIHITTSHSGKMKYMYSLSTNALMNPPVALLGAMLLALSVMTALVMRVVWSRSVKDLLIN